MRDLENRLSLAGGKQNHHVVCSTLLLAIYAAALLSMSPQAIASTKAEVMQTMANLKRANAEHALRQCRAQGRSEKQCEYIMQITDRRERDVLVRTSSLLSLSQVNMDHLSREVALCYRPDVNVTYMVRCWEKLIERIEGNREKGAVSAQ